MFNFSLFTDIEREEKGVQKAIREAAKRNDMVSAKVLQIFLLWVFVDFFFLHFFTTK